MKKSKKYIIISLSLLLAALIGMGVLTYVIDPLFQYHTPWFGLEPYLISERYQLAGVAKNFEFENVIMGNSFSQNFVISDVEKMLEGETVQLAIPGSYPVDWAYLLNILKNRSSPPKYILMNFDPRYSTFSPAQTHDLPIYLYDDNVLNDVNYWFNYSMFQTYTLDTIRANKNGSIPDFDTALIWGNETVGGKDLVLQRYEQKDANDDHPLYMRENLAILEDYFVTMPETQFMFFVAPFSILYWKVPVECGEIDQYHADFNYAFETFSKYPNVTLYFWDDADMLNTMCDLDCYVDQCHYDLAVSQELIRRMDAGEGIVSKDKTEWESRLNAYFEYLKQYDYEHIFE